MNNATKGVFLAVLAAAAISSANVSVKYFLRFTNPESLAIAWYLPTVAAALAITFWNKTVAKEIRNHWKQGLVLGLIYFFAAIFWFNSIDAIGAELTGFITRLEIVFAVILAVLFLKEKLNPKETAGMAVAVAGTVVISYSDGNYLRLGSLMAVLASFAIALHLLAAKVIIKKASPVTMLGFRNFFAALLLAAYVLAFKEFKPVPSGLMPALIALSILSSFIGFYLLYKSLKYLDAAKAGALRVLDPVFILLYVLLIFQTIPSVKDMVGGFMVMAGVAAMSLSRKKAEL